MAFGKHDDPGDRIENASIRASTKLNTPHYCNRFLVWMHYENGPSPVLAEEPSLTGDFSSLGSFWNIVQWLTHKICISMRIRRANGTRNVVTASWLFLLLYDWAVFVEVCGVPEGG